MTSPPDPFWVYLDTNMLIDLALVFRGWKPPSTAPTKTERQIIAAARIFFYGYRQRCGWYLVVSADGRQELTARGAPDWTVATILDMDSVSDSPSPGSVAARAAELQRTGIKEVDARHAARAELTPWVRMFVSNDQKLLRKARLVCDPAQLSLVSAVEAEGLLNIQSGEAPPIAPAPGSALAGDPWWIPPRPDPEHSSDAEIAASEGVPREGRMVGSTRVAEERRCAT